MSVPQWFSTRVRFAVLLSSEPVSRYHDSVFLLRAEEFAGALAEALRIGRARERTYTNGNGDTVRWALASIISLDALGPELHEGIEVHSEPIAGRDGERLPFDTVFHPELDEPVQTV